MNSNSDSHFEPVELPTGRQVLPDWVRGATVDWWRGYGNSPEVRIKVPEYDKAAGKYPAGLWRRRWPDPEVYVEEKPGHYVARHEDGRVHQLFHETFTRLRQEWVDVVPAWCWISGRVPYEVYEGPEGFKSLSDELGYHAGGSPLFHRRQSLVSRQDDGFAGAAHDIEVLRDGALHDVRLRGPWHVAAPEGCVETAGSDSCTMTVTEDLWLRVVATYAPHLRVFRTSRNGGRVWLEAAHGSWDCPKAWLPADHPVNDRSNVKNGYSR